MSIELLKKNKNIIIGKHFNPNYLSNLDKLILDAENSKTKEEKQAKYHAINCFLNYSKVMERLR